jgi:hypothetical protein
VFSFLDLTHYCKQQFGHKIGRGRSFPQFSEQELKQDVPLPDDAVSRWPDSGLATARIQAKRIIICGLIGFGGQLSQTRKTWGSPVSADLLAFAANPDKFPAWPKRV